MSFLYSVLWFENPYGDPVINTEMLDYDKPLAVTKEWLADQAGPAGAIVIVYRQTGLVDLTPVRSHVLINEMARIMGNFEEPLHDRVNEILDRQGRALPRSKAKKKTPAKPSRQQSQRNLARSPGVRRLAGQLPAKGKNNVADVLADIRTRPVGKPCKSSFFRGMQNYATPGVLENIAPRDIDDALQRFIRCDWGDVTTAVARANNRYTRNRGGQIHGVYQSRRSGIEFWMVGRPLENMIITLLPSEL